MSSKRNGSRKKGREKGRSTVNEVVTREHAIIVHKRTHEWVSRSVAPRALKEIWIVATKEMGTPDVCIDTRLHKSVWAKGERNVPYRVHVQLSKKHNEDKDSPNKLYMLVTCIPVTLFKNLQTITVASVSGPLLAKPNKGQLAMEKWNCSWNHKTKYRGMDLKLRKTAA
ncbi:60S ribosomal protein L31-like [Panthera tigris]|uniref:60S ribosomal protein L31-like n=1 Tax=Panthera tigris TaxID=9694 RepID=UPI00042BB3CE|nr:60S ribosomal protein L31-like [Panthera tigris]